jgi:hypothetical protein
LRGRRDPLPGTSHRAVQRFGIERVERRAAALNLQIL